MNESARNPQDPQHFRALGRAVVHLGLLTVAAGTGGLLAAALAVGAPAATFSIAAVGAKLVELGPGVFASLSADGVSKSLSGMLARRWASSDASLVNHDLANCLGGAIQACLQELARDEDTIRVEADRSALSQLAERAPRLWARIATYPGTAKWTEAELREAIDGHLAAARDAGARGATAALLDAESWAPVLDRMLRNSDGIELSDPAFTKATERLAARTGFFFFELLKQDAATDGRQFAAALFASLGEMRRELPMAVASAVVAELEDPRGDAAWRHRAVIRRLRKLDTDLSAQLATIDAKLTPELPLDEREPLEAGTQSLTLALRAQQRAIPLLGRDAEIEQLLAWLGDPRPMALRLVTGLAGTGKTRLAQELCDMARVEGWHAGFLGRSDLDAFLGDLTRNWAWRSPTLVVIDYAAARVEQLEKLLALIERQLRFDSKLPSLRVLLLERHRGLESGTLAMFLTHLGGSGHQARNDWYRPGEDLELAGFEHRPEFLLETLAASFVVADGEAADPARLAAILPELRLEASTPLLLQLAVHFRTGIVDGEIQSLLDLLGRWWQEELVILERLAVAHGLPLAPLRALLVLACLRAGLPDDEVELQRLARLECERWALGDAPSGAALSSFLATYLGRSPAEAEPHIAPLEPDLMAEYAVLEWLREHGTPSAKRKRLLVQLAAHATERAVQVGAFLIRMCEDLFDSQAWRILEDEDWWVSVSSVARDTAVVSLPKQSTALSDLALFVTRACLQAGGESDQAQRAGILNNLALRFSSLGLREEALQALREAESLFRDLAKTRPEAFEPHLASALNNLGLALLDQGHRRAALRATEESVEIRRRLAQVHPEAFEPDLATALNNLGTVLSELGQEPEALQAVQESLGIRIRLVQARPGEFESDLASALSNLGNRLAILGAADEAFEPTRQAVALYRQLAKARPDVFEPDLSLALNNLALVYLSLDLRNEALKAVQDAVRLRRRLAVSRPERYEPLLAESLGAMGSIWRGLDPGAAAASFQEGLRVLLPHLRRTPLAFAGLATSLGRHSMDACQEAGIEPDAELHAEVAALLPPPPDS
ncbi:MAG: tetratricopeptide repeat protein [Planctomycetaceae bacterium]|nr:tetratricopeptide repeat protein [Planctomycetaceae bacterium]